jgi:hypothetical protein
MNLHKDFKMIEKTEVYTVEIRGNAFDNLKAWDYEDFDGEIISESKKADVYKAKAAAKVRFDQMCMNLQKGLNDMVDIETDDGANHLTVPSEMSFKLIYTQPDGLVYEIKEEDYQEADNYFKTRDGRFFKKGELAIEQLIKDAAEAEYKIITNYWNPTEVTERHAPAGVELNEIDVPSINGVSVTATKIIG